MSIRERRLRRDNEMVAAEFSGSDFVQVRAVAGQPPNHYEVTYHVNGLAWDPANSAPRQVSEHVVDIYLPLGYPKQAPRCTMRTPIWHPNIGDYVCIGDYWSAGVTLVDIIAHIGDMIQYKSYNLKSPVSKEAAAWAQRNTRSFPIGTRTILSPAVEDSQPAAIELRPRDDLDISLGPIRDRR